MPRDPARVDDTHAASPMRLPSDGRGTPTKQIETVASMVSYPRYLTLLPREENEFVIDIDCERVVRRWDSRAERLLGFTAADAVGVTFESLLTKRHRQREMLDETLQFVARTAEPRRLEVEHRTTTGGPVTLRGVVSAQRSDAGVHDGWLLIMHRAIEDHCLDCRLLFYMDAITSDSADAIIILDEDEHIRSWNRGAEEIYGFAAEEALGQPVEILFPRDLLEAGELDYLRRAVREHGYIRAFETTRVTRDGRVISVELTRSAIRDSHGNHIGTSAIVRDITRRKLLEEKLLHAERLAVVGRMAAQVAHELRNPLSSISLNAELLADELSAIPVEQQSEAKTLLDSITREIDRLAAVSEEYLQFARLPEFAPAPTDVALLVEDLAEFAEIELTRAGVKVSVEANPVPNISVDRKQLRQALLNLIRNALEAMDDGGTLTLRTGASEAGDCVEISVADTGRGVVDSATEHMFEPFFSTKDGGTGLGLSIARRIAHEHGGELTWRNSPEGGAIFTLSLPIAGVHGS